MEMVLYCSTEALAIFGKRVRGFQDMAEDWNNDFGFRTLDGELAQAKGSWRGC